MDNNTLKEVDKEQNIQLVKGTFNPDKALEVMNALIDQKINFHKIEGIQLWEKNHKNDQEPINKRIQELELEKKNALEFITKMKAAGKNIEINGTLHMTSLDE